MTGAGWSAVEAAARLLERDEHEAVLGDLAEAGGSAWHGLLDVSGLVIRRQAVLWKSWRPWLASAGLALPGSLLLMGFSISVSWMVQHAISAKAGVPAAGDGLLTMLRPLFLLIACSWTGGFVAGAVSRRTLWMSAVLCFLPCLFCLARFREPSLSRLCLLLFLLPAVCGARQALRASGIRLGTTLVLAVSMTMLILPALHGRGTWVMNGVLLWPAWYMVAAAQRRERENRHTQNSNR